MYLYQVRPRVLRPNGALRFPGRARLRFQLAPNVAFGDAKVEGNVVRQGSHARLTWDANVGRQYATSDPPLEPIDLTIDAGDTQAEMHNGVLTVSCPVTSAVELWGAAATIYYALPVVLSVDFHEPPAITQVTGDVDGVAFSWELARASQGFEVTNLRQQEDRFAEAWNRLNIANDPGHRRLIHALHYFHVAVRLQRVGSAPWEFMAEILLNLCKVLEVLFPPTGDGKTRDAVRQGLASLGFGPDEIEGKFLSTMALRDRIGVAHVSLASFPSSDLRVIHAYTEDAEGAFRDLIRRVMSGLEKGTFLLAPYDDSGPSPEDTRIIEKLCEHYEPSK